MEMETLSPTEVRVLGALLEKDMTTPEYYPLTLLSLQAACNQKSNRDPVVNYDEDTVSRAIELARDKGLIVRVTGAGHRVDKFGHRLGEKLNLGRRELALLCVLMLRGPQTVANCAAAPSACTISRIWKRSSDAWSCWPRGNQIRWSHERREADGRSYSEDAWIMAVWRNPPGASNGQQSNSEWKSAWKRWRSK